MDEFDDAARARQTADGKRFIDLAVALEAPYIRVFGTNPDGDKSIVPDDKIKAQRKRRLS